MTRKLMALAAVALMAAAGRAEAKDTLTLGMVLEPRLRETAYALACEVVAADRFAEQDSLRMLEFVKAELRLDPLVAAAIERGARARHQLADPGRG